MSTAAKGDRVKATIKAFGGTYLDGVPYLLARSSVLLDDRNENIGDYPGRLHEVGIYALKRAEDVLVELFAGCSALCRTQASELFASEHARVVWIIQPRHG